MQTDSKIHDIEEIRTLLDTRVGHFADKSARWLFKEIENLRGLVLILAADLAKHLDFTQTTIENRSFVDDTLRGLVSDMVFTVPYRDPSKGDALTIYILIEHQSTEDPMMGYRMLSYMCQIWNGQQREFEASDVPKSQWRMRPILPIIFYTGSQRWKTPPTLTAVMDVPELMLPFVPSFKTLFFGVKDIDPNELTKTDHPMGWLMTVLQKEHADETSMRETLEAALTHLDTLAHDNIAQHRNALIYLYHLVLFRRPETEQEHLIRLLQTHTQDMEVENIIMTGAEALIERGKAEGIEQGKAEGIEQGKAEGIEQGKAEGERNFAVESILDLLGMQFPSDAVQSLKPELEQITDLNRLKVLIRATHATDSLDAFKKTLQEQQNGS